MTPSHSPSDRVLVCSTEEKASLEARNTAAIFEYVTTFHTRYDGRDPCNVGIITELHQIAFQDIYETSGNIRDASLRVLIGGRVEARDASRVWSDFVDLMDEFRGIRSGNQDFSHVIRQCTAGFHEFLLIHPFWDGNGRVSRGFLHLMLYELGVLIPPEHFMDLFAIRRDEFISALQAADAGDLRPLTGFILRGVLTVYDDRLLAVVASIDAMRAGYVTRRLDRNQRRFMARSYRCRLSTPQYFKAWSDFCKRLSKILAAAIPKQP